MSSSVDNSSTIGSFFNGQNVIYAGIAWAVISLLFFLLFGVTAPGEEKPFWYLFGTYVLELPPFLLAAFLCYRNWRSPQIASGTNVWLGIGLAMLCWFIGGLLFGWWELYFGLEPDVSPADLFYIFFYVFLSWGMVLAVIPRRLNLEVWQWLTVAAIAAMGIALAIWLAIATPNASESLNIATEPVATELSESGNNQGQNSTSSTILVEQESTSTTMLTTSKEPVTKPVSLETTHKQPPDWAVSLDEALHPLSEPLNFFLVIGDVFLLIIASALLLAFWGGRFSQSWRMIAAATFSLYIGDMWFKYAEARAVEYESGGLLEVSFVFSGVLFAIGAALEYEVSSRSRRGSRRRTKELA
ncbi:MAG: hypothetical protein F6K16_27735 [Symploca sp. SIO2B6]|nr:hypothetical protein [Symploca sp. SIO2B6]